LLGDADRVLALFDKAAFVENQGTVRTAKVIVNKTTILGYNVIIIPWRITDKTLHCSDIAIFHGQRDGFNGFSLERTELPGHVFYEVLSGLTTLKTIVKLFVESSELIHKIFYIAFVKIKLGNRIKVFVAPRDG
jgi:hypothetical protein